MVILTQHRAKIEKSMRGIRRSWRKTLVDAADFFTAGVDRLRVSLLLTWLCTMMRELVLHWLEEEHRSRGQFAGSASIKTCVCLNKSR